MSFKGFEETFVPVQSQVCGDLRIFAKKAGTGPPLVLLHGFPQTHYIWHKIANQLVESGFTCIIPDLRGYGKSSKPKASENHVEYSKREMASDIVQVAKHFGYSSFYLVAHDRGARVSHRLVLDHPEVVKKLMLIDICPTLYMYEHTDQEFATRYWHWFFQLLPAAEQIIAADPVTYFDATTWRFPFQKQARESYLEGFSTREGIHGACEDYRAAASIDLEHDREDREKENKISVSALHILWGTQGLIPKYGDVVGVWKSFSAEDVRVTGKAVESGHYIPEQASDETLKEILAFLPLNGK